jgi:uncharacterized protein YjgD (DUF1641 family)
MNTKPFEPHDLQESSEKLAQQMHRIKEAINQNNKTRKKGFFAKLFGWLV